MRRRNTLKNWIFQHLGSCHETNVVDVSIAETKHNVDDHEDCIRFEVNLSQISVIRTESNMFEMRKIVSITNLTLQKTKRGMKANLAKENTNVMIDPDQDALGQHIQ